jgi:molecular chaperone DnaK
VLQGERSKATDNKSLGRFDLSDIPPAPRGMPQVEVTFDIDANGILNVSARDKATGKEQKIVIKASSGLNDDEIDRMVADAEAHAAEDAKFRELADTRNQADALMHATQKSLSELGDKVEAGERARIESALADVREALKGDSKDKIETKLKALSEASASMAQKLYAEQQSAEPGGGSETDAGGPDENIVDAEFEEVEDDDKKSA